MVHWTMIGTGRRAGGQQVQAWWYRKPGRIRSQFESKARTPASLGPALHGRAAVLRSCNGTRRSTSGTCASRRGRGVRREGPDRAHGPPTTRACTVGGGGVGPRARAPAATKRATRGDGVPAHRGSTEGGGGINQRTSFNFPTSPSSV